MNFSKIQFNNYKKYKYQIYNNLEIYDFIFNKILNSKFILYGGMAIDMLIKDVTNNKHYLYDKYINIPDIDVYSINADQDSKEIANYLSLKLGINNISIKTGINPNTRKIYIEFISEAILDITEIPEQIFNTIKTISINGYKCLHPDYIKKDYYQILSVDIYSNYYRFNKTLTRIKLLEKYFPIQNISIDNGIEESLLKKYDNIPNTLNELNNKYEIILCGDYIYNFYYENGLIENILSNDIIILSNNIIKIKSYHIGDTPGILISKKIRIMPLYNEIFYNIKNKFKIVNKITLCYFYYTLKKLLNTNKYDKKIYTITNDSTWFDYFINKKINIYEPIYKYIPTKKKKKNLKNIFID